MRAGARRAKATMIQQRVGDLLEINYERAYSYVVVLTKIVRFGGNIVFAYHPNGKRQELPTLLNSEAGFNICTDLLLPKRDGHVTRLQRFEDTSKFWRTRFLKATNEYRLGVRAKEWFIYRIGESGRKLIANVKKLKTEYCAAMDSGCYSFDLVVEKIRQRYTPDQNEHI
jgi:hypothetical protein